MKKNLAIILAIILTVSNLSAQIFDGVRNSMFSDIKAHNIGDVITVIIVEQTKAEQNSKVENNNSSSMSVEGSTSGNIFSFIPLVGGSSKIDTKHDGKEGTAQNEKLVGKVTATITERNDSGMLTIKGRRMLEVNGEKNMMKVEGMVRPKDIMTDNTVYSYNIANAEISYKKGNLERRFIKPGRIRQLLSVGLAGGLMALAYIGFFK